MNCLLAAGGLTGILLLLLFPFWKPKKQAVSVLLFSKAGTPFKRSKLKREWVSRPQFEKLLRWLKKHKVTTVTAAELAKKRNDAGRTVLLAFSGGFQSFYTEIFPLLQAYKMKASVFLPVQRIGQYNAWQNPQQEPWQNLLTAAQIAQMYKSELVDFNSAALDYADFNKLDADTAIWQAKESKLRLKNLYKLDAAALHYPFSQPKSAGLQHAILDAGYAFTIGHQKGLNLQPLQFNKPLNVWTLKEIFPLWRLYFKLTRG